MLCVAYAEFRKKSVMLSVVKLNVIMLNVMAPKKVGMKRDNGAN